MGFLLTYQDFLQRSRGGWVMKWFNNSFYNTDELAHHQKIQHILKEGGCMAYDYF